MRRILGLCLILLTLAACNNDGGGQNGGSFAENSIIQWDRDASMVVFQADVVGGPMAGTFLARNQIPLCTIYGDNRVVWTNDLGDFNVQVLWDQLTDQQIQDFIAFMTITQQVFNYDAGMDLRIPGPVEPVVEVITVNVNGREHKTDAFSSEAWPLDYFEDVVTYCSQVSRSPVLFEPQGAWLSVESVEYDSTRPLQIWNSETTGLNLTEVAESDEPLWITGQNLRILWNIVRTSSFQTLYIDSDGNAFNLVLEVPGVHPTSPPAPES